jgi:transposase
MTKLPALPPDFSRDELWSLVREMGTALMEAEKQIAQLREENARLRANPQHPAPAKTSQNSSLPPSRDHKANVPAKPRKKRGGKAGHTGKTRPPQDPDQIVECVAAVCPRCGRDLSDVPRQLLHTHQVVDIPPIQPIVYEIRQYQHQCTCGACVPARLPQGYAHSGFGPNLHTLLSYFNGSHHIAHDRLGQMMQDVFGLHISDGAICNSLQRTAKRLIRPAYDILRALRREKVIGSDETGMRVAGENWWCWVLQAPRYSYFAIADTRGQSVPQALMGDAEAHYWVCDLFSAQLNAPAQHFAFCNAHQLRDIQYAIDAGDIQFGSWLRLALHEALKLSHRRDEIDPDEYVHAAQRWKAYARRCLELPVRTDSGRRLQERFRKYFDNFWRFLDDPDIPFDNNASERALRPVVIHRKVIGGFRSEEGASAYTLYRTVEDTARKQGQKVLDTLYAVLGRPLTPDTVCFSSL